jgi:hypothetical protein
LAFITLFLNLHPDVPAGVAGAEIIHHLVQVALGLPVATNILLTALIVGRIYYLSRGIPDLLSSKRIPAVTEMLIESGTMVIVIQLIYCVLASTDNPSNNAALCVAVQVYVRALFIWCEFTTDCWVWQGIAPTIIIFRVGIGRAVDPNFKETAISSIRFASGSKVAKQSVDVEFGTSPSRTAFSAVEGETKTKTG